MAKDYILQSSMYMHKNHSPLDHVDDVVTPPKRERCTPMKIYPDPFSKRLNVLVYCLHEDEPNNLRKNQLVCFVLFVCCIIGFVWSNLWWRTGNFSEHFFQVWQRWPAVAYRIDGGCACAGLLVCWLWHSERSLERQTPHVRHCQSVGQRCGDFALYSESCCWESQRQFSVADRCSSDLCV